jgi:hypothetical protein
MHIRGLEEYRQATNYHYSNRKGLRLKKSSSTIKTIKAYRKRSRISLSNNLGNAISNILFNVGNKLRKD